MCSDLDPITFVCLVGRGTLTQGRFTQQSAQWNLQPSLEWDRILTAASQQQCQQAQGSTQCSRALLPHSWAGAPSNTGPRQQGKTPSAEQQTCLLRFENLLYNGCISGRIRLSTVLSNTLVGGTSEWSFPLKQILSLAHGSSKLLIHHFRSLLTAAQHLLNKSA